MLLKRKVPSKKKNPPQLAPVAAAADSHVLDREHCDPKQTLCLEEIVLRVVSLAQVLLEKSFYAYQIELSTRVVESLLNHDGDVITSLMARQAGKTETIGGTVAAIAIIFPTLAKQYPKDWRLNITDDKGNYRGFAKGVKIGIYAPRQEQAEITFERVRSAFETKSTLKILGEINIKAEVNNGNEYALSNGSVVMCQSASEQSKIEGATHHLLIAEEAQDISDMKMRKSLHPMVASTAGTIVKIGTASTKKCDFYDSIRTNKRLEMLDGKRNHFFFPYTVCQKFNSFYAKHIENEKRRIGEMSDEFRMSYGGEWIFERGMFVTQDVLFRREVAITQGIFSVTHWHLIPSSLRHYSVVVGIDWGSSHDSTVVCVMVVDWNNPIDSIHVSGPEGASDYIFYKKHVVNWLEFRGDNYEYQFGEIVAKLNTLPRLSKIVTDSNTCGQPIFDRLTALYANKGVEVEGFNFQPKLKSDGYKSLSADLWANRITFPAGAEVQKTMEYRSFLVQMFDLKKEYKNGLMVVAHPDERGAHDDYPDAFMLAAWGCNKPSVAGNTQFSNTNPFI